ncbi:Furin-like protease 2 [Chionoecetes opilio]|uniref:Furin-like protease 2 n=1 Tax=Chionoecetes opilio TaxID=41210 RepID=A0A8J4YLU3_CHIOP|nr:Furin-like protease 2 [Chionoecetes opilio]
MMDSCMTCIEGWRIKGIHCVAQPSQCSIRYFSMRNGVCQACHPTCLTCTGSSASQCLHCEQPYYLHNSECVQRCPEGLYGSRGHCLPCPHGCQSCSSYSACSQCSPAFHLYNNRCVASCPARSFSDRGVCSPCETNCKTCYGPRQDQCASCLSGSFLLGTTCHSACPTSHYPEATECLPCYQNCLTCKGAGIYDCTSCHDFFTLDGGMCIECPSGRYYNVSHITRSQACEPCSASCLTCSAGGENSCTSCQSPKSLHPATSTCRECCPAGVAEDYDSFCCSCDPGTGQCYGAVSADKRRIALSLDSAPHTAPHKQLYFYSVTTLIAAICFVNLVIFGAVFTVLQARSTGSLCWANDYSYRGLKSASTFERVSLTVTPFLEDESEEERENTVLYLKT